VAIKPEGLTMVEAASIPLVALTAWQALVEKAASEEKRQLVACATLFFS
jgi:NADPH:quinone reductase-like Zn-dependent oxidoreductase